ncbi:MAG TPA: methylmalonyl Co-A mutase-associated GTPase MeaB [Candidatus Krumholzibacteriaceae bacterium]|jgi:LAO/AO transport system kinase|nr:methylmalonyl Co-A mutase-associated GTPase MeaB [Candidatus Krumholzibacteriaceae bacterium]
MLTSAKIIAQRVLKGDKRSIARAISQIENEQPEAQGIISLLYPRTGKAHIIGITGPGGCGKSTLVEKLVKELRHRGKTVGVVAVDPTSPFTGGAFLGDRIRMQELSTDEGVFIRSMATRNTPGGLARATKDAVHVLDASGKDVIIVETAGAGQSEVEIIKVAYTILVVSAPGLGDEIQAIKAGIMEIGDIFVVNKADRENADKAVIDIQAMLETGGKNQAWKPPIIKTVAIKGDGVSELLEKILEHKKYLESGVSASRYKAHVEAELLEVLKQKIAQQLLDDLLRKGELDSLLKKILAREVDPYSAADKIIAEKFGKTGRN